MFFYLGVFAMATPALLYSFPRLFREPDETGELVDFGPVADDGPAYLFTSAAFAGKQTATEYSITDSPTQVTEPGDRVTTYDYPIERPDLLDPLMALTVETDPEGRVITLGEDVRDFQHVLIEEPPSPSTLDPMETRYDVNALGETLKVTDSTGAMTTCTGRVPLLWQ